MKLPKDSWRSYHMKAKAGSQSVTVYFTSTSFQAFIKCVQEQRKHEEMETAGKHCY